MTVIRREPAAKPTAQGPRGEWQSIAAIERWMNARGEAAIAAWTLAIFAVLWMAFHTISLWPVDLRDDASEAAVWAQHFAFGYKHPPLTAWLFMTWFAIFPRANWAMHLETIVIVVFTLGIIWRLLRDHLDRDRALLGLFALILIPLFTFKAAELNANTAMMPFWAAALLFYLRARRGLGILDSLLAGAFASLTLLGKYWAVYLLAGMAIAAVTGAGTRRFWRSPSPYLMAVSALIVIAPHLYWYVTHAGGADYAFIRGSVMTTDSFGAALRRSVNDLLGIVAYAIGPLLVLALLRPGRAALADIIWPDDDDRRQALILFAVPMVLPALVNLVSPYRLTPDWTFPNWALLPIVLYGSRKIAVDAAAAAGAALLALAVSAGFAIAAPFIAYVHLKAGLDSNRPSSQELAQMARTLTANPTPLFWGSPEITGNLPFYLAGSSPLDGDPLSPQSRGAITAEGLLIACLDTDTTCKATAAKLAGAGGGNRAANAVVTRTFLGFSAPPLRFHAEAIAAGAERARAQ